MEESQRKDVECLFGILQVRFGILRRENQRWDLNEIIRIGNTCVIIHNILVRLDQYSRDDATKHISEDIDVFMETERCIAVDAIAEYNSNLALINATMTTDPTTESDHQVIRHMELTDKEDHYRLQKSLINININPM